MIDFRLYLVTDRSLCLPSTLSDVIRIAVAAGVRAVQLREKDLSAQDLKVHTETLSQIVRTGGGQLFVNRSSAPGLSDEGFVEACAACSGYHLPESVVVSDEMPRRLAQKPFGVSTHSVERAVRAEHEGASFITFGPVFATPSKRQYGPPMGCDKLAAVVAATRLPVLAIGGITPDNALRCIEAGAHGVSVIGSILGVADTARAVGRFQEVLGEL